MDYYNMIIHTVIGVLASTQKNPQSARAIRLRAAVEDLKEAADEYLIATDPTDPIRQAKG